MRSVQSFWVGIVTMESTLSMMTACATPFS